MPNRVSRPASDLDVDDVGAVVAACSPLVAAGDVLLVCDFDATLAHRSPDPWAARIVPASQRALRRLVGLDHVRLVFLSGRAAADLAVRVRVGRATYLGDHGAETARAARGFRPAAVRVTHEPVAGAAAHRLAAAADAVPLSVGSASLVVERKAAAVTFHFRAAPDVDAVRLAVLAALDGIDPDRMLERIVGRRSVELRPPGAATKASTLAGLIDAHRPRAVIAVGDGKDDAAAWDAMRTELDRVGGAGLAIAVAGYPDISAEVAPRADRLLGSPDELAIVLRRLADIAERDRRTATRHS